MENGSISTKISTFFLVLKKDKAINKILKIPWVHLKAFLSYMYLKTKDFTRCKQQQSYE